MSADKIEHCDNPTIGGGEQFFCGYQGKYISTYLGLFGNLHIIWDYLVKFVTKVSA